MENLRLLSHFNIKLFMLMIYIYFFINVWLILNLTNCRKIQTTFPSSKSKRHEASPFSALPSLPDYYHAVPNNRNTNISL